MTANVETMFYAGQTPWHKLGRALPDNLTADEAYVESGLDWSVNLKPLYDEAHQPIERFKATVRSTDGRVLGVVQKRYMPVQNKELFVFADSLLKVGGAHYHTAGSLAGGRRVWVLAQLPTAVVVKVGKNKDETACYLLVMTAHDGTLPVKVIFTPVRVVCQNTLNLAISQATNMVTVRHTTTAVERMKVAVETMKNAQEYFQNFSELAQHLASKKLNSKQLKEFVESLFPSPRGEEDISTVLQNKRDNVVYLFEHGRGHDKIKGTAWAALNGAIEFADYAYGRKTNSAEKRAESVLYGAAAYLKQRALTTILKVAA